MTIANARPFTEDTWTSVEVDMRETPARYCEKRHLGLDGGSYDTAKSIDLVRRCKELRTPGRRARYIQRESFNGCGNCGAHWRTEEVMRLDLIADEGFRFCPVCGAQLVVGTHVE